jgi:hypothetical protein
VGGAKAPFLFATHLFEYLNNLKELLLKNLELAEDWKEI